MNKISRKALAGVAALAIATMGLAGCAAKSVDACAVSDEGSWNDKSFNEAVMKGITKAETELKVTTATAASATVADIPTNLQAMADQGCKLTFAVGFNAIDAVNAAAKANPSLFFVTVDGANTGKPAYSNLKPVNFKMEESSYLAGYLAAAYSKTHVVGTYGGIDIPAVTAFMDGFYYGAKKFEADSGTATTVVGWDPVAHAGDFMGGFAPNSPASKTIAATQLQAGADVIFPVGGNQYGALSSAIDEAGADAVMIGVDQDIALTSPEYAGMILTSVEKRMTNSTFEIIQSMKNGEKFNSEPYIGTLKNGGTGLSPLYDFESKVDPAIMTRIDELSAGIQDGSINPLS